MKKFWIGTLDDGFEMLAKDMAHAEVKARMLYDKPVYGEIVFRAPSLFGGFGAVVCKVLTMLKGRVSV